MIYLRARYYDPSTGQFISRDPAVAMTRQPYAYVNDNPLNMTDPSGLFGWSDIQHLGGMAAGAAASAVQYAHAGAVVAAQAALAGGSDLISAAQDVGKVSGGISAACGVGALGSAAVGFAPGAAAGGVCSAAFGAIHGAYEITDGHPWDGGFDLAFSAAGGIGAYGSVLRACGAGGATLRGIGMGVSAGNAIKNGVEWLYDHPIGGGNTRTQPFAPGVYD